MDELTYLAVFKPSKDGYAVSFPDLPGCIASGKFDEEAKENAEVELELYIFELLENSEEIPKPSEDLETIYNNSSFVFPITVYPDILKNEL
jgi:predicted RNase H-like HicB family nuclease